MRSLRAQVKGNRLLRAALFEAQNAYVEITLPERVLRATADLLRELGYPEELYDGAPVVAGCGTPGADPMD